MKAEIVAVGTELLLGQIVNTNAQYLAKEMAGIGVDVYYQTVVGDNPARLKETLQIAAKRADFVILTGGLGPTQDDLTRDTVAELAGKSLIVHQPSMDKLLDWASKRNTPLLDSNKRMAYTIDGSDPLDNDTGQAVGSALEIDGTYYVLLPGPPKEMKPMFDSYAKAWIRSKLPDETPLFSKILKFSGIGESNLEHALKDLIEQQEDVTIAPYAGDGEVTLRLSTKARARNEAFEKLKPVEAVIAERVGDYLYAEEDIAIEQVVIRGLIERGITLSVAESCTGGMLGDLITSIPGSSAVFLGGVICYTNQMKHRLLNVPIEMLEGEGAPGAVSQETAEKLAEQVRELTDADFGLSITGVAGPGESESKPVGTVFIAVAERGNGVYTMEMKTMGSREIIKRRAAKYALHLLWRQIR